MQQFSISTRKNKKYMTITPKGKLIHFGAIRPDGEPYSQYKDSTPIKYYSYVDHKDKNRRDRYRARHKKILDKSGKPAYLNKENAAYYAWRYLWT